MKVDRYLYGKTNIAQLRSRKANLRSPAEVAQEAYAPYKAAQNVAERQSQKQEATPMRIERESGDAQKRNGAGFRGDDRQQHAPPGQAPAAQQIIGNVALPAPDPKPEQDHADQVGTKDGQIDSADRWIHYSIARFYRSLPSACYNNACNR